MEKENITLLVILNVILYVFAIYFLVKNWKIMPNWAQVLSIIFLVIGMPIFALIFGLVAKK